MCLYALRMRDSGGEGCSCDPAVLLDIRSSIVPEFLFDQRPDSAWPDYSDCGHEVRMRFSFPSSESSQIGT
jgi:hypothetical protein